MPLLLLLLAPLSSVAKDLGELSANPYQQNSTANRYGAGSPFAPNGINNSFSPYGSPFSNQWREIPSRPTLRSSTTSKEITAAS
ncbi:MAG: hypothetical protein OJF51_003979 [Nitrospira sp.]|jgi:hypothetical protein|nr:MAG: hypothetical protein OJF51_003979 [Nitrospira sp.]